MPSPQKAKGSGYEREIAKYLSDTYGESFIRAPGSGAYVGGKNQTRKEILHEGQIRSLKGDVVPGQSFKRMNIECKFCISEEVYTSILEKVGIITAINIRQNRVTYEVTFNDSGNIKTDWFDSFLLLEHKENKSKCIIGFRKK